MNRPVIALVVPAFDKGGLEQVVLNLYRGYRALGAECFVFVENNETGYMVSRLDDPGHCFIFNRDESLFLAACRARKISHIHYHYSVFALTTMAALGFNTTYTLHNVYTWLADEDFAARAVQIMAADQVVAVSAFVRDYFCKRASVPWEDVLVVPNGTDFADLDRTAVIDRTDYVADPQHFVFANIASSHRNKHQAVIVRAAEKLLEQRDDFVLLLVGNVGDGSYHQEIADMISRSPASGNVRQVPYVDGKVIGAFYRGVVDCVLLASLQEGCSNVVLEALATGRRMIVTDVGNAREAATLSDRAIVVPAAYPDLMALTPGLIERFSRSGDTRNVEAITTAMMSMMDGDLDPVSELELENIRARISVGAMVEAYYSRFLHGEGVWRHLWS